MLFVREMFKRPTHIFLFYTLLREQNKKTKKIEK